MCLDMAKTMSDIIKKSQTLFFRFAVIVFQHRILFCISRFGEILGFVLEKM